ncbi:DUF4124 domain-containing protein [Acidithiobacillus ferriphilus]|uniref:DUF4124 domain-containing protein n=1 Tax=Acidithiobacillus ferriphilus TaxID=1689834 RepID=UPI00232DA1B9|nr:DUF4124 domain-containing protein [Acidithiobacillus ferriphilus]WCE94030.1 DUF4124 domain-containing protein [Acidithiobacillus ferriphilus]
MNEKGDDRRMPDFGSVGILLGSAMLISTTVAWGILATPLAFGDTIYRWVSPSGVVSYGNQPPRGARKIQTIPPAPSPTASTRTNPGPTAAEEAPSSKTSKAQTAIARLNLLAALNNYQNSLQTARTPPRNIYTPGFIGPYFPYGVSRFRERHPQHYRRPAISPPRQPSMVLLPPSAPNSAYSSPALIP